MSRTKDLQVVIQPKREAQPPSVVEERLPSLVVEEARHILSQNERELIQQSAG
jgi:hypothetical protein